jgi:hypothetical protein
MRVGLGNMYHLLSYAGVIAAGRPQSAATLGAIKFDCLRGSIDNTCSDLPLATCSMRCR